MTKTFTAVVSYGFANPTLSVMMPLAANVDESFVRNFEFGLLEIICDLVFGA
jgi:hypothetical protein